MRKPTPWMSWFVPLCMAPLWVQCEAPPAPPPSRIKAMTNRVENHSPMVFSLLQLKTRALLEDVQLDHNRVPIIDAMRKSALLAEQEAAITLLRSLSPQVQIVYRYRFVLNGLAVVMPRSLMESALLPGVIRVKESQPMERPRVMSESAAAPATDFSHTSVSFIGAEAVWKQLGITGKGVRVGIIDTGIDYTHRMLGGSGEVADYKAIDPSAEPDPRQFPNAKVRGGIDLVGSTYNSASGSFYAHIPHPKKNPLDESGHGTHVAGTIAGIGDGVHTYTGVAPDAALYAIKVFGKQGSTEDAVVIAGLEYAVDPDGDLDPRDRLDVVNLSLGSNFGLPFVLYEEAVRNFTQAGITAIMSAGNSGNIPYIVGSPGSSTEAISVAASIDNMAHNWKFPAVRFRSAEGSENFLVMAVEGSITKPISDSAVSARLVDIGKANNPVPPEIAAQLAGNVALIERGEVHFAVKLKYAQEAGAIGVVMINNQPGEPTSMGGEGNFPFPGIMVTREIGVQLRGDLAAGKEMWIDFSTSDRMEDPTRIDTLTAFSSRGPRALDSLIKPEITAPGHSIVSAEMGGGDAGVQKSGTSMAAPHMAGVVALLKQAHPDYTEADIRAALLATTVVIQKEGTPYSVAYQGTGRVQSLSALTTPLLVSPATWSLGELAGTQTRVESFRLRNTQSQPLTLSVQVRNRDGGIAVEGPTEITLAAGEVRNVEYRAVCAGDQLGEHSAWIEFRNGDTPVAHISLLSVTKKLSDITADTVELTQSGSADVKVENRGSSDGEMLLFQYLGGNPRQPGVGPGAQLADVCDLQSAGYRLITSPEGKNFLQVAVKLYRPISSWEHCEISVQIAGSDKKEADWELLGTSLKSLVPKTLYGNFYSAFTDATRMHDVRIHPRSLEEDGRDYTPAIVDMHPFVHYDFGTLGIVEVDIEKAKLPQQVWMKIATLTMHEHIRTADDFLGGKDSAWMGVSLDPAQQAYSAFPLRTEVPSNGSRLVSLQRGKGQGTLVAYFPYNRDEIYVNKQDSQEKRLREISL